MSAYFNGLVTPGNFSCNLNENKPFHSFKNSQFQNIAKRKTFLGKLVLFAGEYK